MVGAISSWSAQEDVRLYNISNLGDIRSSLYMFGAHDAEGASFPGESGKGFNADRTTPGIVEKQSSGDSFDIQDP